MAPCTLLITTFLLLSVFTCSPASATWRTRAAVERWIRTIDSSELRNTLLTSFTPGPSGFTWWRSSSPHWVVRWDRRNPFTVFPSGFSPLVDLSCVMANPTSSQSMEAMDLRTYVESNTPSIYVSTTQVNSGRFWTPRYRGNRFRYDIYAPGGIDVNPTLGSHRFQRQTEVAFVGGVDTQYIVGAVELNADGEEIAYHVNPLFQGDLPPDHPQHCDVPNVNYPGLSTASQQFCQASCSSSSHPGGSSRRKRSSDDYEDVMRSDGEVATPGTSCLYCLKIATSITFYEPYWSGYQLQPYGHIQVSTSSTGSSSSFTSIADVWRADYSNIPSVREGTTYSGRCAILRSHTQHNNNICFNGRVRSYNFWWSDRDLASFPVCTESTSGSSTTSTTSTDYGSVTLDYTVQRCSDCTNGNIGCC